jgi:hypothetical protein
MVKEHFNVSPPLGYGITHVSCCPAPLHMLVHGLFPFFFTQCMSPLCTLTRQMWLSGNIDTVYLINNRLSFFIGFMKRNADLANLLRTEKAVHPILPVAYFQYVFASITSYFSSKQKHTLLDKPALFEIQFLNLLDCNFLHGLYCTSTEDYTSKWLHLGSEMYLSYSLEERLEEVQHLEFFGNKVIKDDIKMVCSQWNRDQH